jgi:protoporphyrinogen oxidase
MYMPKLEEVIRGAVGVRSGNRHYITEFRYPTEGGFVSYAKGLSSNATFHLGTPVAWIDSKAKQLGTRKGTTVDYETLISSLPLPVLVNLMKDAPVPVRDAAAKLRCTALYLIDIGVQRSEGFPNADWLYFYDEDISFARVSFPHRFAPSNVPPGHGSIQAEIYFLPSQPPAYSDVLSRGIEDMLKTGLLSKDDKIVYSRARTIPYGNVVFDHQRQASLATVESYLDSIGILRCGRYGLWNYHWTDESIVSGWKAAEQAMSP